MIKKDIVHHSFWNLLLYKDGIRPKKYGGYLSVEAYIDDLVVKLKSVGICLTTSKKPLATSKVEAIEQLQPPRTRREI
jgi:hypothetical protein